MNSHTPKYERGKMVMLLICFVLVCAAAIPGYHLWILKYELPRRLLLIRHGGPITNKDHLAWIEAHGLASQLVSIARATDTDPELRLGVVKASLHLPEPEGTRIALDVVDAALRLNDEAKRFDAAMQWIGMALSQHYDAPTFSRDRFKSKFLSIAADTTCDDLIRLSALGAYVRVADETDLPGLVAMYDDMPPTMGLYTERAKQEILLHGVERITGQQFDGANMEAREESFRRWRQRQGRGQGTDNGTGDR